MASVEGDGQVPDDASTPGTESATQDGREPGGHQDEESPPRKPRPGFLSRCIARLGLDVSTVLMMLK